MEKLWLISIYHFGFGKILDKPETGQNTMKLSIYMYLDKVAPFV